MIFALIRKNYGFGAFRSGLFATLRVAELILIDPSAALGMTGDCASRNDIDWRGVRLYGFVL